MHPITRLLAHNKKEMFNGQTHFYQEFTDLLRADGHVIIKNVDEEAVKVNPIPSEEGVCGGGSYLLEQMIGALTSRKPSSRTSNGGPKGTNIARGS